MKLENMIPFVDLKAQYRGIKEEIDAAIGRVLASGQFVLGEEVAALEDEFAAYFRTKFAIGVNSGTSALHLALLAAGIGAGDEVITVPFTFVATVAAILYTGARPIFVDIEPRSFTIDVGKIEKAITPRTKAILPVHLYGQPADMDPILTIARRHHLVVIEDAAQAHGAEYLPRGINIKDSISANTKPIPRGEGRRVGGIGDLGCFSFYPGKNLGAYGEGGMVVTNNPDFARTIRMLRDWGQERKYHHVLKGYNYRMEGLQGAILRVKLRHLDAWTDARRAHAALYNKLLAQSGAQTPEEMSYARHVYHIYAVRTPHREVLQQALHKQGIQTGIHYPVPVHLLDAYADLGYQSGEFSCSEQAAAEVLSLPMHPELSTEQIVHVADCVIKALG